LVECNEWAFAKGAYVVVLQRVQVAAPLWKILFLECVSFFPDIPEFRRYISKRFGFP